MKDGWYFLVYQGNEAWIDSTRKRVVPEVVQEAILSATGKLEDVEGYLEVKNGKGTFLPSRLTKTEERKS